MSNAWISTIVGVFFGVALVYSFKEYSQGEKVIEDEEKESTT